MKWYEKLGLGLVVLYLIMGASLSVANTVVKRHQPVGPFTLVLRYSHHTLAHTTYAVTPEEEKNHDWVDVVDHVEAVGPFSGWDTCDGAALEAQARQQDPAHDAYVTASCLYLGHR